MEKGKCEELVLAAHGNNNERSVLWPNLHSSWLYGLAHLPLHIILHRLLFSCSLFLPLCPPDSILMLSLMDKLAEAALIALEYSCVSNCDYSAFHIS